MSDPCKWCGLRQATQTDHDTLPEGDDGNLCWRSWNSYADCFEIEGRKKDAAPDLLAALEDALEHIPETLSARARAAIAKAKAKGGQDD